ncbi:MAG TPA: tryptophan synthase subunit alpha [Sphingobacteriaceae bacterium]|nr:tryptophan synthase subunit alpha [Sphingobacteriaceae bacterium]
MNRLKQLFEQKKDPILSIYYTAGYPELNNTLDIAEALEKAGVDFLEIGFPYSDPVADGPVIQNSSEKALHNGMTLKVLFDQLKDLRKRITIPILLMGYVNPVLQYGVENFCKSASEAGVDGVIVADLPIYEYEELYRGYFEKHGLSNIFLITPQTSEERIRKIDSLTSGFIYMVSSSATTGKNLALSDTTETYFSRVKAMNLKNPLIIGFGISDKPSFEKAAKYASGAIVGSAFVKFLEQPDAKNRIKEFVGTIR